MRRIPTEQADVIPRSSYIAFLTWRLETSVRRSADALVIAGDVFDSATAAASAERISFEFLAAVHALDDNTADRRRRVRGDHRRRRLEQAAA